MKICLFNYIMLGYISPRTTCLPQLLQKKFFTNPSFRTHTPSWTVFLIIHISITSHTNKHTIIRDLCRFLKPGLIFSTTFDKKLGFPTAKHKRIYKLIMALISSNWKQLLRTETSRKYLLKNLLLQQ